MLEFSFQNDGIIDVPAPANVQLLKDPSARGADADAVALVG